MCIRPSVPRGAPPLPPDEGFGACGGAEAERWAHRCHEAVDWALRLRAALEGCREALGQAGSDYEPPAGWDVVLGLPEL